PGDAARGRVGATVAETASGRASPLHAEIGERAFRVGAARAARDDRHAGSGARRIGRVGRTVRRRAARDWIAPAAGGADRLLLHADAVHAAEVGGIAERDVETRRRAATIEAARFSLPGGARAHLAAGCVADVEAGRVRIAHFRVPARL